MPKRIEEKKVWRYIGKNLTQKQEGGAEVCLVTGTLVIGARRAGSCLVRTKKEYSILGPFPLRFTVPRSDLQEPEILGMEIDAMRRKSYKKHRQSEDDNGEVQVYDVVHQDPPKKKKYPNMRRKKYPGMKRKKKFPNMRRKT